MKPLSKEASAALSALKTGEPSAADEARVRKNLERTLGIVIPAASVAVVTTSASVQAAASAATVSGGATAMSLGAKVVAFGVLVGVTASLTVVATRTARPMVAPVVAQQPAVVHAAPVEVAGPAAPAVPMAVEVNREVSAEPAPVAAKPSVPVVTARAVVVGPAVVAPVVAPAVVEPDVQPDVVVSESPAPPLTEESSVQEIETHFPNCDPVTEMRSALNAKRLLVADRAEEAVWLLGAYQKRCPSGRWSNTAWSVRIAGLCKLGRTAEVINLLEWFGSESLDRRAAVMPELKAWCSEEVLKHGEPE